MYVAVCAPIASICCHSCNSIPCISLSTLNRWYGNHFSGLMDIEFLRIPWCTRSELDTSSTHASRIFVNAICPVAALLVVLCARLNFAMFKGGGSNWFEFVSTIRTDLDLPVPTLTRQNLFTVLQIRCASNRASSAGLLWDTPPSTKVPPGGGISILIALKYVGAALVARAASQIAHLSAL